MPPVSLLDRLATLRAEQRQRRELRRTLLAATGKALARAEFCVRELQELLAEVRSRKQRPQRRYAEDSSGMVEASRWRFVRSAELLDHSASLAELTRKHIRLSRQALRRA
jgi:hypothetical protein